MQKQKKNSDKNNDSKWITPEEAAIKIGLSFKKEKIFSLKKDVKKDKNED